MNFVYATWLRSYKWDSPITKYIQSDLFFQEHQKIVDHLLSKPTIEIRMACDEKDEDLLFGYAVLEPSLIHFVYVKDAFRKMGIARALLQQVNINACKASHVTYSLLDLWSAGKVQCEFNPYSLGEPHVE